MLVTFYSHAFLYTFKISRHLFPLSLQLVMLDSISYCFRIHCPILKKSFYLYTKIASRTAYVLGIKRSSVCAFLKMHRKYSVKTTYVPFLLHHNSSCIVNFWCYSELSVGVRSSLQHTINIQGSNMRLNHCMT